MSDPFHEAKQALNSAKVEFTATNSLSLVGAFAPLHAADLALRDIYTLATGTPFPHDRFKPQHQPGGLVDALGIKSYYSLDSQLFLNKLTGHALQDVRYEGTQAYKNYISTVSSGLAAELIKGAEQFTQETEALATNQNVLNTIKQNAR
jgi:hypothetical protein